MLLGWVWGFLFLSFQSARGFREGQALWLKQVLRDGSLDPPANGTKAGSCSEFFNFKLKLLLARRPLLLRSRRLLRCVAAKDMCLLLYICPPPRRPYHGNAADQCVARRCSGALIVLYYLGREGSVIGA